MEQFRLLERQYKALANSRRLRILSLIKHHGMLTVTEISESIRLKIKPTSKHLQILEAAHMLDKKRRGKYILYMFPEKKSGLLKPQ